MGKQKIVVRVRMTDAKRRSKALRITVGLPGVVSAALEGDEKDRIVVVGEGIDSVILTVLLRKQMGSAELVTVAPVEETKKPTEKTKDKEDGQAAWPHPMYTVHPYQYHYGNGYQTRIYDEPSCRIM